MMLSRNRMCFLGHQMATFDPSWSRAPVVYQTRLYRTPVPLGVLLTFGLHGPGRFGPVCRRKISLECLRHGTPQVPSQDGVVHRTGLVDSLLDGHARVSLETVAHDTLVLLEGSLSLRSDGPRTGSRRLIVFVGGLIHDSLHHPLDTLNDDLLHLRP